jgi:hypothetical protein
VSSGRASVGGHGFSDEARQLRILDASATFLDDVLARGSVRPGAVSAFARDVTPLVMANATEATRAQLDRLHAQVGSWRSTITPAEWSRLHVVVIGPHMPRQGEVSTQYFLRLLGEPEEGRRVIYAESQWEVPQALELLATHELDGAVGEAFFGEALRMHRDLLSDAAREYLPALLPR